MATFDSGATGTQYALVPCAHPYMLSHQFDSDPESAEKEYNLGDRSVTRVQVDATGITVSTVTEGYNTWLPIVVAACVYAGMILTWLVAYFGIYQVGDICSCAETESF